MQPLRQYQERAVQDFIDGKYKYLAAAPGLGKSRIALEVAKRIGAKKIIWFTPATAKIAAKAQVTTWWPEAKTHMPGKPDHVGQFVSHGSRRAVVTIINPDKISRGQDFTQAIVNNGPYDLLIIDEAHQFKSMDANRTRAMFREIVKVCDKILPMSGTPVMNGAQDLYVPLRFLAPERILNQHGSIMNRIAFEDRYTEIVMKRIGSRMVRTIAGSRNLTELNGRITGFFLHMTKEECLSELPPLQFVTLPIQLAARSIEVDELNGLISDDMTDEQVLAALRDADEHLMSLLTKLGYAKAVAACNYLQDFLTDNPDRKIVIWSTHHAVTDHITSALSDYHPAKIDGRDSQATREAQIQMFLNDASCRVFVGNIKACGTGITLLNDKVKPSDVFFIEQSFSVSDNTQASCRVHRLGQNNAVLARIFVADAVPADRRVQEILQRKQTEIAEMLNDIDHS